MPIPNYDHNDVLPPHLGSPTDVDQVSPYHVTTIELIQHFATSVSRKNILYNYLMFRSELNLIGITHGYQWLDGSFMENVEVSLGRSPNDLDLLTLFWGHDTVSLTNIRAIFPPFFDPGLSKHHFLLDHYPINLGRAAAAPEFIAESLRYWLQLFSHNRLGVWKGMLRINLNTPNDDADALDYLKSLP